MFSRASLRYLVAIILLLASRWKLRQWYEYQEIQNYILSAILFLSAFTITAGPVLKNRWKELSRSRVFILALLMVLSLPWGEWLQFSMPFARENWSQQILDQTLFLVTVFLFFELLPAFKEKIQRATEIALSFLSQRRIALVAILILSFCIPAWIDIVLTRKSLLISDSGSHLFQARIFSQMRLFAPIPPAPEFFNHPNDSLVMHDGKWFSVSLPGFALLLAFASIIHAEWFVPPVLALLTLAIWFAYIHRWHDRRIGVFFGILFVSSPFLLLHSSSIMVHIAELFFASAIFFLVRRETEESSFLRLILLALCLCLSVLTRGFSLMPFLLPVLAYIVFRRRSWNVITAIFIGLVAGGLLLAIYQSKTTGSPFLSAYLLEYPNYRYGFGESLFGQIHSPFRGVEQTSNLLLGLNRYLTGWYSGSLFFIFAFLILNGSLAVWDRLLFLCCFCLASFYFFFVAQDLFTGPRFLLVCSPILLLIIARCIELKNPAVTSLLITSLVVSLPRQIPELVSAWLPAPVLQDKLAGLQGRQALIFLGEKVSYILNSNDPFLRDPQILCKDLGGKNQIAVDAFPEHHPYYFGLTATHGKTGITGNYGLSERRPDSERDYVSYFRLALLMQSSRFTKEKDFFDFCYTSPIGGGDSVAKFNFVNRSISQSPKRTDLQNRFSTALHHSAAAVLLPRVAFYQHGMRWRKSFEPGRFRTHFLNAKKFMGSSGELGKELSPALDKVSRRIDKDRDENLSDEEILRFVGKKLRLLEEY